MKAGTIIEKIDGETITRDTDYATLLMVKLERRYWFLYMIRKVVPVGMK